METIFYTDKSRYPSSVEFLKDVLIAHYGVENPLVDKTENGKPYLKSPKRALFFSVSHTDDKLYAVFSDENIGLDVEKMDRTLDYLPIAKKFPFEERQEIADCQAFLRHWTVKESTVKWLGGTLAHDLKKLTYAKNRLYYGELELPLHILVKEFDGYFLTLCKERDFGNVDIRIL